jgi:hypothetical protein
MNANFNGLMVLDKKLTQDLVIQFDETTLTISGGDIPESIKSLPAGHVVNAINQDGTAFLAVIQSVIDQSDSTISWNVYETDLVSVYDQIEYDAAASFGTPQDSKVNDGGQRRLRDLQEWDDNWSIQKDTYGVEFKYEDDDVTFMMPFEYEPIDMKMRVKYTKYLFFAPKAMTVQFEGKEKLSRSTAIEMKKPFVDYKIPTWHKIPLKTIPVNFSAGPVLISFALEFQGVGTLELSSALKVSFAEESIQYRKTTMKIDMSTKLTSAMITLVNPAVGLTYYIWNKFFGDPIYQVTENQITVIENPYAKSEIDLTGKFEARIGVAMVVHKLGVFKLDLKLVKLAVEVVLKFLIQGGIGVEIKGGDFPEASPPKAVLKDFEISVVVKAKVSFLYFLNKISKDGEEVFAMETSELSIVTLLELPSEPTFGSELIGLPSTPAEVCDESNNRNTIQIKVTMNGRTKASSNLFPFAGALDILPDMVVSSP